MSRPRVAIVGGGLAGLAAAAALAESACDVHLFEARRQLGGRAASFKDTATGALVDFCQHVSMGCCTNLADFCRRTGIDSQFHRERTLYFIGPDGRTSKVCANKWLPAPLHLAPALLRLSFLSLRDRWCLSQDLLALARTKINENDEPSMADWLKSRGTSPEASERFWSVVLVSALGDTLDRVSLSAAKKVFVDGFMANRTGYEVMIPEKPLSQLFNEQVGKWLTSQGVKLFLGTSVQEVARQDSRAFSIRTGDGQQETFDQVIIAVPWRMVRGLISPDLQPQLPWLANADSMESSPITGVHLWFDREITSLPHAVIVGRLSQWFFNRGPQRLDAGSLAYYCQVVISASRELAGRTRDEIVTHVRCDLTEIWPATQKSQLLSAKVVTEQHAVFTPSPGRASLRPNQKTAIEGLYVAGDWTATGWPATMEGAVRSGYLAAEAICRALGEPRRVLMHDLPRARIMRMFG